MTLENITVAILVVIVFSAGIWSWWFTNHDSGPDSSKEQESIDE